MRQLSCVSYCGPNINFLFFAFRKWRKYLRMIIKWYKVGSAQTLLLYQIRINNNTNKRPTSLPHVQNRDLTLILLEQESESGSYCRSYNFYYTEWIAAAVPILFLILWEFGLRNKKRPIYWSHVGSNTTLVPVSQQFLWMLNIIKFMYLFLCLMALQMVVL